MSFKQFFSLIIVLEFKLLNQNDFLDLFCQLFPLCASNALPPARVREGVVLAPRLQTAAHGLP